MTIFDPSPLPVTIFVRKSEKFNMKRNKTLNPSPLPKRYVISERPLEKRFYEKKTKLRRQLAVFVLHEITSIEKRRKKTCIIELRQNYR